MIECRLTKTGYLHIFISIEGTEHTPVSARIQVKTADLSALNDVALAAYKQSLTIEDYYPNVVVQEGACTFVLYAPTQTATLCIKGVSMTMPFKALRGLSTKISTIYNR